MENKKYFYRIDILRLIFCLCVVVLHFENFYPLFSKNPFFGFYRAVDFFFILSGFLLMKSYKTQRYQTGFDFFSSKLKKLLPLNILMLSLMCFFSTFSELFANFTVKMLAKSVYAFFINMLASVSDIFFLQIFIPVIENFMPNRAGDNLPIWYVSAMLIAEFLWFCLLSFKDQKNSNKSNSSRWVLLVSVFIYSYLAIQYKNLDLARESTPILHVSCGFLRGFADVGIGIFLANYKIEVSSSFLKALLKIFVPLFVIVFSLYAPYTVIDFVFIAFVSIMLLFEFSYTPKESKFLKNIGRFASKASLVLYFSHFFVIFYLYTPLFQKYPQIGENFFMSLLVRCGLLTVTGFAVYWLTKPVEKIISNILAHIKTAE